jgi:uncharacterized membrane protein HdeD (DUF308 family)
MLGPSSRQWWAFALQGILGIVFGIGVLAFPGAALLTFVALFAAWAIISGIGAIAQGLREGELGRSWPHFLMGAVAIVAGVLAFFVPASTLLGLILFVGAWQVVAGLTEIYMAYRIRREIQTEWLLAAAGVLRTILGVVFLVMPSLGIVVTLVIIAANAFAFGILAIIIGLRLRGLGDRAMRPGARPSTA